MGITARASLFAAFFTAVFTGGGCANQLDIHQREDAAGHDTAFVAQDDDLIDSLTVDDEGWSTTAVMERDEPFGRVALRYDSINALQVQVRARSATRWSAWTDVLVTFTDEGANNAHVDVDDDSTAAQVRFDFPDEAGLTFLVVETFIVEPIVEDGTPTVDAATPEDLTQGLAADGIVVTRSQWGARARSCGPTHRPNRLTIHHTVTPNNDSMSMPARLRQIQAFHIDSRGWCDVGYHFLIGQDGKVYQGRMENVLGAHAANDNSSNVGISFIGTHTTTAPSSAVLDAGARIIKAMGRTYGITLDRNKIKGHRQVGTTDTSCPGDALYARLQNLIDRAKGTPTTTAPAPTTPAPTTPTTSFTDVPPTHSAAAAIAKLKARGVFAGCTSTRFCPNDKLTRGQMATILAGLMTSSFSTSDVPAYTDVPSGIRANAREVVGRGVMESCSTGGFCHAGSVTRASIAVYAVRAMSMGNLTVSRSTFSDVAETYWASGAVERLYSRQIVSGCSTAPLAFCPADDVTRAQAAVIIAKSFNL